MARVYRRGRIWWVRFLIDGQQVRRSARTERKSGAQALLLRLFQEAKAERHRGEERQPHEVTVDRFSSECRLKPGTRASY